MGETDLQPGTASVLDHFSKPDGLIYADTASYGLPPNATVEALEAALDGWKTGAANWVRDWDPAGEDCRSLLSELLAVPSSEVALLPAVSAGVATIAASLGPGDEVVVPDDEFNSVMLPLRVAEQRLGVRVVTVPFADLPNAVSDRTTLVASSHVRSNDGRMQDLDALSEAARSHGALSVVDITHSAGIVPLELSRRPLDVLVGAAYKHLLCPRGVAFMRVAPELCDRLAPFAAGWRATSAPYASYYGASLGDLAAGAARFDISLAWHPWVGARESLRFLLGVPANVREEWCVGLASALAERLGVPPTGSSVVGVPVRPNSDVGAALTEAQIVASMPLGVVRVSFHIYNDPREVQSIATALAPFVEPRLAT
jgi:selenocysteine lyase/cysteine desulfurase